MDRITVTTTTQHNGPGMGSRYSGMLHRSFDRAPVPKAYHQLMVQRGSRLQLCISETGRLMAEQFLQVYPENSKTGQLGFVQGRTSSHHQGSK